MICPFRDRDRIRTCDRLLRRQVLYPAELRDHFPVFSANWELKILSGWQDSNLRPPGPKPGAMTGLRYTPKKAERQGLEPWRRLPVDRLAICSVTTPAPLLLTEELIPFCGCKCRITFYFLQLFHILFSFFFRFFLKVFHAQ